MTMSDISPSLSTRRRERLAARYLLSNKLLDIHAPPKSPGSGGRHAAPPPEMVGFEDGFLSMPAGFLCKVSSALQPRPDARCAWEVCECPALPDRAGNACPYSSE